MKSLYQINLTLILGLILVSCSSDKAEVDPDLKKATTFVKYLNSQRFLSQSAFTHVHREAKPSEFVSYLFSTIGSAEWVVIPGEEEMLKSARIPVPPTNVVISHRFSKGLEKQLILSADDTNNTLLLSGYVGDSGQPMYTASLPFQGN